MRNTSMLARSMLLAFAASLAACAPTTPAGQNEATGPTEATQEATAPEGVERITVSTGVDLSDSGQVPQYSLQVGQGHWLLYVFETERLIYDGTEIASGNLAGLMDFGMALSRNGLHYAYTAPNPDNPGFTDLLADGSIVDTAQYLSQPAVTDDGQGYFFLACVGESSFIGTCLFKNHTDIFLHGDGIVDYQVSADGSTFLADLRSFDANESMGGLLVLDGLKVHNGASVMSMLLSGNGQHYAFATVDATTGAQSLHVDGAVVRTSTALHLQQLTDSGSYCGWDAAKRVVFINQQEIPVTAESQVQCYINADATQVLVRDGGWFLNGQPIALENAATAEFAGDHLYVYSVVK